MALIQTCDISVLISQDVTISEHGTNIDMDMDTIVTGLSVPIPLEGTIQRQWFVRFENCYTSDGLDNLLRELKEEDKLSRQSPESHHIDIQRPRP